MRWPLNLGDNINPLQAPGRPWIYAPYKGTLENPADYVETAVARSGYGTHDGPELVHPFASAIDTDFPAPLERTHMMLKSKAQWIEVHAAPEDQEFDTYPQKSLAEWHKRRGWENFNP